MTGFTTDYTDVKDNYGLIPEGQYEVIIKKIEERTTQNGATGLNLTFVIRNDVEQKHQNRCIFHTLWKRKDPTDADKQVQGYSFKQIMILAKSAALPSGKVYENVHALCADLVNRVIRVTIAHDEYNGNKREVVKYTNASQFPECKHVYKESVTVTANTVAQRPQETFAAETPLNVSDLGEFEEILGDGDIPF